MFIADLVILYAYAGDQQYRFAHATEPTDEEL
jgi:hypothetical protein